MVKQKGVKYYAVAKGRNTGVFASWDDCLKEVKCFPDARYQAFPTYAEAEAFANGDGASTIVSASAANSTSLGKRKSSSAEIEDDGFEAVYCDGACKNNGQPNAVAGIGIWWGENDDRNRSFRCPGTQTNNHAELLALVLVLLQASMEGKPLVIRSDSKYAQDCVSKWAEGWKKRGWTTAKGEPVKNRGVIEYLLLLLDARKQWGHEVKLEHVPGHAGIVGNEGADKLAVAGTLLPTEEEWDYNKKIREFKGEFEMKLAQKYQDSVEPDSKKQKASPPSSSSTMVNTSSQASQPLSSQDSQGYFKYHSREQMLELAQGLTDNIEDDLSD